MRAYVLALSLLTATACDQVRTVPQAAIDSALLAPAYVWIDASNNDISTLNTLYLRDNASCEDDAVQSLQGELEERIEDHIITGEKFLEDMEGHFYLSTEGFVQAQTIVEPQLDRLYLQQDTIDTYHQRHD